MYAEWKDVFHFYKYQFFFQIFAFSLHEQVVRTFKHIMLN